MKAKDAKELLNCSYGTLKNYVQSGKIKLKKILPNGRYDYDDKSIYSLLGSFCEPKKAVNFILVVEENGNKHEYFVDETLSKQILSYLNEKSRKNS